MGNADRAARHQAAVTPTGVSPAAAAAPADMPRLFTPYTLRGLTLRNRVVVSPMCRYKSDDGAATDWHLVHLGKFALGGAGLVFCEETAVEARAVARPTAARVCAKTTTWRRRAASPTSSTMPARRPASSWNMRAARRPAARPGQGSGR